MQLDNQIFTSLRNFDLNLLLVLEVLLEKRHISKAAQELGLTQSAVSKALQRIRSSFSDEILVRTKGEFALTPKAQEIRPQLVKLLQNSYALIETKNPKLSDISGVIRVATTDYGTSALVPLLMRSFREKTPDLKLRVSNWTQKIFGDLAGDKVDLGIGAITDAPTQIYQKKIGLDELVVVASKTHPILKQKKLSKSIYEKAEHIVISNIQEEKSIMEKLSEREGLKLKVLLEIPHFLPALEIIATSDLLISVPAYLAHTYKHRLPLCIHPLPYKPLQFYYSLLWHKRYHQDPYHKLLRSFIYEEIQQFRI